jgi:hypothetical protein
MGMAMAGRLNILGWNLSVDALISKHEFKLDASMDPLKLGGILQLGRALNDFKKGPRFFMQFSKAPPSAAVMIKGAFKIEALQTSGMVDITLGKKGFALRTRATILGLATADFALSWKWNLSQFRIAGSFVTGGHNGFAHKLFVGVLNMVDYAVKNSERAATYVQGEVKKSVTQISSDLDKIVGHCKHLKGGAEKICKDILKGALTPAREAVKFAARILNAVLGKIAKVPRQLVEGMGINVGQLKKAIKGNPGMIVSS